MVCGGRIFAFSTVIVTGSGRIIFGGSVLMEVSVTGDILTVGPGTRIITGSGVTLTVSGGGVTVRTSGGILIVAGGCSTMEVYTTGT